MPSLRQPISSVEVCRSSCSKFSSFPLNSDDAARAEHNKSLRTLLLYEWYTLQEDPSTNTCLPSRFLWNSKLPVSSSGAYSWHRDSDPWLLGYGHRRSRIYAQFYHQFSVGSLPWCQLLSQSNHARCAVERWDGGNEAGGKVVCGQYYQACRACLSFTGIKKVRFLSCAEFYLARMTQYMTISDFYTLLVGMFRSAWLTRQCLCSPQASKPVVHWHHIIFERMIKL